MLVVVANVRVVCARVYVVSLQPVLEQTQQHEANAVRCVRVRDSGASHTALCVAPSALFDLLPKCPFLVCVFRVVLSLALCLSFSSLRVTLSLNQTQNPRCSACARVSVRVRVCVLVCVFVVDAVRSEARGVGVRVFVRLG